MGLFIHEGVKNIARSLNDLSDWDATEYRLINKKRASNIWIANGRFFLDLNNHPTFTLIEKFWLWPKVRAAVRGIALKPFLEHSSKDSK